MVRTLHGAVALIVVLAGCSAIPGNGTSPPPDRDLSVTITNDDDESYVVRVIAIPAGVDGVVVTYANGSTRRFEVSSFDALAPGGLRNATAIATVGSGGRSETFTVGPSEGLGTTIEDVPANATVAYFVLPVEGPERVRAAGVVRCTPDAEHTDLAVTIRPDGSLHAAVTCSDDAG